MPSPFPGMDPWLEGPEWAGVHGQLVAEIGRQLTPRLLPRYVARMQVWFAVDSPEDDGGHEAVAVGAAHPARAEEVYPDVGVVRGSAAEAAAGQVAVFAPPLELETVMPQFAPQQCLEIRDVAERQLVAAIEVLSPWKKRGEGYEQYLERRLRVLRSSAHLIEIDLLRRGRRVPMRQALPDYPYFVFVSRAGRRPATEAWPAALRDPLPRVPVPLLRGDPDVLLDLQQALSNVYDLLGYAVSTDYGSPPRVPLEPADAMSAEQRVRDWRAPAPDGGV